MTRTRIIEPPKVKYKGFKLLPNKMENYFPNKMENYFLKSAKNLTRLLKNILKVLSIGELYGSLEKIIIKPEKKALIGLLRYYFH